MRKLRIWTTNLAKVRGLEYQRLQRQSLMGLDEFIPDFRVKGCNDPIHFTLAAVKPMREGGNVVSTEFIKDCGKPTCWECSSHRRRMWAARAFTEISVARRTWFVTLTASDESIERWFAKAEVEYRPGIGPSLKAWQYDAVVKAAYEDVKRFKMRCSKLVAGLRFLVTVEKHTGKRAETAKGKVGDGMRLGLPHFHAFVHETGDPISWRKLKKQADWIGLSEIELVDRSDTKAAWYVCKYLTKDNGTRNVWPSSFYGRPRRSVLPDAEEISSPSFEDLENEGS